MAASLTFGRIARSNEGGPLRRIHCGGRPSPSGFYSARKSHGRHLPWESRPAELQAIILSDVSWRVSEVMSQPHRLDIFVRGEPSPLHYIPDLELVAEPSFAREICSGVPLAVAAMAWNPKPVLSASAVRLVLEIKNDDDPRNDDSRYQSKIRLAKEVYRRLGYYFAVVHRSEGIDCLDLAFVRDIAADRFCKVATTDRLFVQDYLTDQAGCSLLSKLINALGGSPNAMASISALHFDRVLCIEMAAPRDQCRVALIERER